MAEALYLITKDRLGGGESFINGVNAVIINQDDGATATARKAAAAAAASSHFGVTFPSTYFDTEQLITAASGALNDAGDAYILLTNEGAAKAKKEGA